MDAFYQFCNKFPIQSRNRLRMAKCEDTNGDGDEEERAWKNGEYALLEQQREVEPPAARGVNSRPEGVVTGVAGVNRRCFCESHGENFQLNKAVSSNLFSPSPVLSKNLRKTTGRQDKQPTSRNYISSYYLIVALHQSLPTFRPLGAQILQRLSAV